MSVNSILFSIFISLFPFLLHSQNNYNDVVYLKNGEIRKGIIVERIPSETLKIKTSDGNIFVFKMEDISKITKELIQEDNSKDNKPKYNPSIHKPKSKSDNSFNQIEFGYDYGSLESYTIGGVNTPSNMGRIKLNFIRSYKFTPNFSLGMGTGLRFYYRDEYLLLPIYTHLGLKFSKFKLLDNKITPYFDCSLGASFSFFGSLFGVMFNPMLGICYDLSPKNTLHISLGYDLQRWPSYYSATGDRISINSFALTIGATF